MNLSGIQTRAGWPTVAALTVAILAVSSSAPLIAFATAPALAVAFWRNALAAAVLTPVAAGTRRVELREVSTGARRSDGLLCVLAGLALAFHFATWMPSVQLTTVATATALVATQPVWAGLIAVWQGRRPSPTSWVGIGLAVAGAAWATGVDIGVSAQAVAGDGLAVLGAMAAAVYTSLGERARSRVSTTTYTWICYGVCAAVLLIICLVGGVRLVGYEASAWAAILALVVGAQLLGHSLFNYSLHRVSATTISVLILLEVPGAAVLAWLWLDQPPRADALPGLLLLVAGVAVVVLGGSTRRRPRPVPVEDGGPAPDGIPRTAPDDAVPPPLPDGAVPAPDDPPRVELDVPPRVEPDVPPRLADGPPAR